MSPGTGAIGRVARLVAVFVIAFATSAHTSRADDPTAFVPQPLLDRIERAALDLAKRGRRTESDTLADVAATLGDAAAKVTALREASAKALGKAKPSLPKRTGPFKTLVFSTREDYRKSIDAAERSGLMNKDAAARARVIDATQVGQLRLMFAAGETAIGNWLFLDLYGDQYFEGRDLYHSPIALSAGLVNWVCIDYLGCTMPKIVWVETEEGRKGATSDTPQEEAERKEMLRMSKAGLSGLRAFLRWLARRSEDQSKWGYPVTLQFFTTFNVPNVRMRLHQGSSRGGPEVPCHFSSPSNPTNPQLSPADAFCLIPKAALAPATTYTVAVDGWPPELRGGADWQFTTGK